MKKKLFIDGQWIEGQGTEFCSINPATDELVWQGKSASFEQIQTAIQASEKAHTTFKKTTFDERALLAHNFQSLIQQNQKVLATIISEEVGKPFWESVQEVTAMQQKVTLSIESYKERCKSKEIAHSISRHKPHGVTCVFGPFNFPGHLPGGHIIPALLAGNTVLFKPSELAPKTAEKITELIEKAGFPSGTFQLLQGAKTVGETLVASEKISGVFFTGSHTVGNAILQASQKFPFRILALEMGGNNPLVISSFSSIQAACYTIIQSAYLTTGQRCTAARRLILIENSQTQQIISQLKDMLNCIIIGKYDDSPEPFMGPLVTKKAKETILHAFENLEKNGGKTIVPCKSIFDKGAFVTPGLIDMTGCKLNDLEFFGPLLQIYRVNDLSSAIHLANDTSYGLSASIVTNSKSEYEQFFDSIRAGVINWNMPTTGATSALPFGGIGKSGNFRPSAYYAADYCAYPVASQEQEILKMPEKLSPGITVHG